MLGHSRDSSANRLVEQGRLIEDFSIDLNFDSERFMVDESGLVHARIHQRGMHSAYRILEFLEEGP